MSYGQIPLRKASEISTVTHVEVKAIMLTSMLGVLLHHLSKITMS